jgi:hypothetical protein
MSKDLTRSEVRKIAREEASKIVTASWQAFNKAFSKKENKNVR